MIETTLRVPADRVEGVLDVLLPLVPGGVHHREAVEEGLDELVVFDTAGGPAPDELRRLAGDDTIEVAVAEVPGGPAERRRRLYRPLLVGPVWIRPAWAPAAPDHALEVALGDGSGFGSGAHPTTRGCIEILLGLAARGSFADLGCGSGILAIVAAKLGWDPVVAVDVSPSAVESAVANSELSGAAIDCRAADLLFEPAPAARTIVANVPMAVHTAIAVSLAARARAGTEPPVVLIASGIARSDREAVAGAYAPLGLETRAVGGTHEWAIVELRGRDAT